MYDYIYQKDNKMYLPYTSNNERSYFLSEYLFYFIFSIVEINQGSSDEQTIIQYRHGGIKLWG